MSEQLSERASREAQKLEDEVDSFHDIEYMDAQVRANIDGTLSSVRILTEFGGPNVWIKTNGRSMSVLVAQGSDHHTAAVFDRQDLVDQMWDYFSMQWRNAEPEA